MADLLIDTGPLVALLDSDDQDHEVCVNFFKEYRGKIFSTEAVLTEAVYLLRKNVQYQKNCIQSFIDIVRLFPLSPKLLRQCIDLMGKYQDCPMDFADSTLVVIAEELSCNEIFTLDRRGFETYRWKRNQPFKICP